MRIEELQNGDVIYAAIDILNDGSVPDAEEHELFATAGTRGMLINTGHREEEPDRMLCMVSFENQAGDLGPPVVCWPEELRTEESK